MAQSPAQFVVHIISWLAYHIEYGLKVSNRAIVSNQKLLIGPSYGAEMGDFVRTCSGCNAFFH